MRRPGRWETRWRRLWDDDKDAVLTSTGLRREYNPVSLLRPSTIQVGYFFINGGEKMKANRYAQWLFALVLTSAPSAFAQNVKITPLGSHTGEFCDRDRATIFEDPTGVRILYDAGHSVTGGDDPRLGEVHVVLLSHAHGDHMGDRKMAALNAGTCDKPETVSASPHSTTAEIAAQKNAALIMIANMGAFIGKKVENIRGKPTAACAESAGSTIVPVAVPCLATMQLGGTKRVKVANAARALAITGCPPAPTTPHHNFIPRAP